MQDSSESGDPPRRTRKRPRTFDEISTSGADCFRRQQQYAKQNKRHKPTPPCSTSTLTDTPVRKCPAALRKDLLNFISRKHRQHEVCGYAEIYRFVSKRKKGAYFPQPSHVSEWMKDLQCPSVDTVKRQEQREPTKEEVQQFQQEVENRNVDPSRLLVMDETAIFDDTVRPRTYLPPGKTEGIIRTRGKGRRDTLVVTTSADGTTLPNFWIEHVKPYHGIRVQRAGVKGMNNVLFKSYVDTVLEPFSDQGALLLMDRHSSHKSPSSIAYLSDKGIDSLLLPPKGAKHLSPLDFGYFHQLKSRLPDYPKGNVEEKKSAVISSQNSITKEHVKHYWRHCYPFLSSQE